VYQESDFLQFWLQIHQKLELMLRELQKQGELKWQLELQRLGEQWLVLVLQKQGELWLLQKQELEHC
jgi:hypothetical protein